MHACASLVVAFYGLLQSYSWFRARVDATACWIFGWAETDGWVDKAEIDARAGFRRSLTRGGSDAEVEGFEFAEDTEVEIDDKVRVNVYVGILMMKLANS